MTFINSGKPCKSWIHYWPSEGKMGLNTVFVKNILHYGMYILLLVN